MARGSPLFELFVRVKSEGLKEINKEAEAAEKKLQALDDNWTDFTKNVDKSSKKLNKNLEALGKILEDNKKHLEDYNKAWKDGTKQNLKAIKDQDSALSKMGKTLESLNKQADAFNKKKLSLGADTSGLEDAQKSLKELADARDDLQKNNKIKLEISESGGKEVLSVLQQIAQARDDINKNKAYLEIGQTGGEETLSTMQQIGQARDELNSTPIVLQADSSQVDVMRGSVDEAGASVDRFRTNLDTTRGSVGQFGSGVDEAGRGMTSLREGADGGSDSMSRFGVVLGDSDNRARSIANSIGGNDEGSIAGSIRKMDVDAKTAQALPQLLGDVFSQLTRFKTIMVAISVATIPVLIAGVAGATGAIAALAAGASALATGLAVGVAGGAATAGAALIGVYANLGAAAVATKTLMANITGAGKAFFAFGTQIAAAKKEVQAFTDLVAKMPAGTEAARAAQERLAIAQEKGLALMELQVQWWNKYGDAANDVARDLNTLQIGLVTVVNEIGGRMIPVIKDFTEIAVSHLKDVALAGGLLSRAINDGTVRIRDFLKSAEGMSIITDIFEAIGRSAEPTFTIISNGLVVMLRVFEPIIPLGYELLQILADAAVRAANFADSAQGMQQIAEFWNIATGYARQLADAVGDVVVAAGALGQALIYSGLVDQMLSGFTEMTQKIRDAAVEAGQADSRFQAWLQAVKPILSATNEAFGEIVRQVLEVVDAVTHATNPSTGMPIIVEILNGIRDAAEPLKELLVNTFEALGPVIATLIPQVAEFMQVFLGSTPELKLFLETVSLLLGEFQKLDPATQALVGRLIAYGTILKMINPLSLGTAANLAQIAGSGSQAVYYLAQLAGQGGGVATALRGIGLAADAAMLALGGLVALAAVGIIIEAYVNWDQASADEAYNQAIESGRSSGAAWGEYFIAGLEGSYIAGGIIKAVKYAANTAEPETVTTGETLANSLIRGFSNQDPAAQTAGASLAAKIIAGIKSQSAAIAETGSSLGQFLLDKFRGTEPAANAAGSDVGNETVEGVKSTEPAMGQAGESTGDAYTRGVESGMIPAEAVAAEGSQATADATEAGLSSIPGTVEQIMQGIPEETLIAWQNATAYAANATAEMTRVITHNLEAIDNNVQVILGQATESVQTKMEEMAAAAQEGVDAVNAAFEEGFSVSVSDYITPMIDEGIAEFTRFSSEAPTELQTGIDAITEALSTLYTDSLASYITPMVDEIVAELTRLATEAQTAVDTMVTDLTTSFTTLGTDVGTAVTTMVTDVTTQMTDMSTQVTTTLTDMSTQVTTIITDLSTQTVTAITDMSTQVTTALTDMSTQITTIITDMSTQVTTAITDMSTQVQTLITEMVDRVITEVTRMATELFRIIGEMAVWISDTIAKMGEAVITSFSTMAQNAVSASGNMATGVTNNFSTMTTAVENYVNRMITAINRMNAALSAVGSGRVAGMLTGGVLRAGVRGLTGMATGGIEDDAQIQGPTGGISDGASPRVVYGEQARNVTESYIVWDRPDNVPILDQTAQAMGFGLVPLGAGMSRGGVRGHRRGKRSRELSYFASGGVSDYGKTWDQVGHLSDYYASLPKPSTTAGGTSSGAGTTSGSSGAGTTGSTTKKPNRRQRKRERRSSSTGTTGSTGAGTTGSSPTSGGAPSTPSMSTAGDSGSDSGTGSPSQQAFPSSCGNLYPVATPTPADQAPYTAAALQESGMMPAPAGGEVGADHVNLPEATTHPGDASGCGIGGSGTPPAMPMATTPMTPSPTSSTIPYDQCLPAHVTGMAAGGTTDSGAAGGMAYPIDYTEVPLGYWSSGLGYAWYGDPAVDWPTLYPPAGWDPSAWYTTEGTAGMARGGILRGGVRHFQGGGLNQYQLEAGYNAANSVLGSPYSYGHAGDDGGFDCSGLWQYIYTAVVNGTPTPDVRWWGTYNWAGGFPGGEGTPGAIPGAMNAYTDLSGWEGDGTHMSGDIMGNYYEAIFSGVQSSSSAAGTDGIWSMGDPAAIGDWGGVTPDYAVDPSGMMTDQVSSWWLCQAPAPVDIGTSPMFGPVENWMTTLPGMTEPFLQDAGQQSIGTLGAQTEDFSASGDPNQWIIAGLEAMGMDTTPEAIAALSTVMGCESGGDPNAVNAESGALGIMQLMPDTWDQFNIGGSWSDPIANIAASINYQLSRYGGLVDYCGFYAQGGLIKEPHLGVLGEGGREVALPLDNKRAQAEIQQALGIERTAEAINAVGDRIVAELRTQTKVMPEAIAGGVGSRIRRDPVFHGHINTANERLARTANLRGGF